MTGWLHELLTTWAEADAAGELACIGFAPASPMFAKARAIAEQTDEQRALDQALERLRLDHHAEWRAVQQAYRPQVRRASGPPDEDTLACAGERLAAWIDEALP